MRPSPSCSGQLPGKVEYPIALSPMARPTDHQKQKKQRRSALTAYKAWSACSHRDHRWRCTRPVRHRARKAPAMQVSCLNLKAAGGQRGFDGCTLPLPFCSTTCCCTKRLIQESAHSLPSPPTVSSLTVISPTSSSKDRCHQFAMRRTSLN